MTPFAMIMPESKPALAEEAQSLLERARQLIATHQADRLPEAVSLAAQARRMFAGRCVQGRNEDRHGLASATLMHAKALRELGTEAARAEALPLYAEALEHLQAVLDPRQPDHANELASAWSQQGITLLDVGTSAALTQALTCFDHAIALRRGLPLVERPFLRWGLAAALMNRADVLTRLGSPGQLQDALRSYDDAIWQLGQMPPEEHPSHLSRLSLAWMNRGLTCQAVATGEGLAQAVDSFNEAVALLRTESTLTNPEQRRLLACSLINRGGVRLEAGAAQPLSARKDALAAIHLAAEFERTELLAAQMGLQARHLLCRAIACLADTGFQDLPETEDWVTETTDAVDEGMALTRHWHLLGESRLEALALDLFRFGSLIYAVCQPHFLADFLLESLDPGRSPGAPAGSQVMQDIAINALWQARSRATQEPLLESLKKGERQLQDLRDQFVREG